MKNFKQPSGMWLTFGQTRVGASLRHTSKFQRNFVFQKCKALVAERHCLSDTCQSSALPHLRRLIIRMNGGFSTPNALQNSFWTKHGLQKLK
ncbi:MAG: hypothetical protein A7316_06650 [Candidatus Altiarchaeales archaeon WOR_SM1_86-2]|nr:MAG: hypothetical protein A7316_06650 [Candidatus Altiarchaeales archaeon WOR_SM1_86-2]ODS41388.1 MAG: hypothetical protein A7315_06405 [Candidatus Altiarchaeales archaeon WOR_SM1_79]